MRKVFLVTVVVVEDRKSWRSKEYIYTHRRPVVLRRVSAKEVWAIFPGAFLSVERRYRRRTRRWEHVELAWLLCANCQRKVQDDGYFPETSEKGV